mgnify:CR=1 FL=1
MRKKSKVEQMEEYIEKCKNEGHELFEFGCDRVHDFVCISKINPPACNKGNHRVVKIPSFVDELSFIAWHGFFSKDTLKNCDIYIPKGCKIELEHPNYDFLRYFNYFVHEIVVAKDHEYYSSENGVLFNKDKTVLLSYPSYKKNKKYRIPDSVVQIAKGAFGKNNYLKNLYISKNVVEIEECPFGNWIKMEVDPENATYKSIEGALYSIDGKIAYHLYAYGSEKVKIEEGTVIIKEVLWKGAFDELYLPGTVKYTKDWEKIRWFYQDIFKSIRSPQGLKPYFDNWKKNKIDMIYY